MRTLIFLSIILIIAGIGCSGSGGNVVVPDAEKVAQVDKSHALWGLWQGVINTEAKTIEFVPLRCSAFHLNALPFLEPPALVNVTLESLEFNGDIVEADIGLRHPFLGLTEFTGFDVCGLFISNGSVSGFSDPDILFAGEGDTRLLNADGYSRWWNPQEFPVNDGTMFSYKDGLLGTPDSKADYSSTLNGYKYFCDDLGPGDPLTNVALEKRGMFSAGQKNIRHYTLDIGAGLIFNYAVDASWVFPTGPAPWSAPDDFPPAANRVEAWRITATETKNTLWNNGTDKGGDLSLQVDVYDWFNAGLNTVRVESPGNFPMVESSTAAGGGEGFSTYNIEIVSGTPAQGEIELLISVISENENFQEFIPGVNTTAYFMQNVNVSVKPPFSFTVVLDASYTVDNAYYDIAPSMIYNPVNNRVYMSWCTFYSPPPNQGSTSDYIYSADSGNSWVDPFYNTYSTGWGINVGPNDIITTMGIDSKGDTYHLIDCFASYGYSLLVKFVPQPGFPPFYNSGIFVIYSQHGNSLIFSHDGYPVAFGDDGGQIIYKRSTEPNQAHPPNDWLGWLSLPQYTAAPSPAMLSKTRNILRDASNNVHLVYFSSQPTDAWIRIASNTEEVLETGWTYVDVYNGSAGGYDYARDPSICCEPDGDWHCAFVVGAGDPAPMEYIAYCRSTDGTSWSDPVLACSFQGIDVLDDPTVDVVEVEGTEIVLITYKAADMIYLIFSWDGGETWQAPTALSSATDSHPDTCTSPDGYVHNVWVNDTGTDYRLQYIRAHFVSD